MDDYFALLGEERRPYLEPERITAVFRELSRRQHPDQPGGASAEEFARLNAAQQTLSDPKSRLGYLIGLEFPQARLGGPSEVPAGLAGLFAPVLALLAQVDALLARKADAASALTRALLAAEEMSLREAVETQFAALESLSAQALADLQAFDRLYRPGEPAALPALLSFHQRFSYLSRWLEQLRERLFQLGS